MVKVGCRQPEALRIENNTCWQVDSVVSRGKNELFIVLGTNFGACIGKEMHKKNVKFGYQLSNYLVHLNVFKPAIPISQKTLDRP